MWSLDDAGQSQCIFPHCTFCLLLFIWIWYNDFQSWLKKRGEGVNIGLLYKSCRFSICYPVSTHWSLPLSFCFWTKPKNELKATLQKEENPVLDQWQANILQKYISKQLRASWVHMVTPQETWIHASHSTMATIVTTQGQICRHSAIPIAVDATD